MLTQHIENIEGWPCVNIDDLVCFLDPMNAFLEQIIAAAETIIEETDEKQAAEKIAETAEEYSEQVEEAVEEIAAEQTSLFPLPADPVQIAIGGSITALLLALSGISANISGAGSAGTAGIAGMAGNTTQQAAGLSSTVQSAAAQAIQNAAGPGIAEATGIISVLKSFFTELFINLRNMITDEGRSYASGKVSEILKKDKE